MDQREFRIVVYDQFVAAVERDIKAHSETIEALIVLFSRSPRVVRYLHTLHREYRVELLRKLAVAEGLIPDPMSDNEGGYDDPATKLLGYLNRCGSDPDVFDSKVIVLMRAIDIETS